MNWVCYDCQPVERLLYGLQVQAGAAAAVGVGAAAAAGCVSPSNLRWAMHKATKLMHKLPSQLNYDCRRRRYATASCDAMTATRGVCEANEPLSLSLSISLQEPGVQAAPATPSRVNLTWFPAILMRCANAFGSHVPLYSAKIHKTLKKGYAQSM